MKKRSLFLLVIFIAMFSCSKKPAQETIDKPAEEPLSDVEASTQVVSGPTDEEIYASTFEFAEFGDLDKKPVPLRVITPDYPIELFKEKIEGSATLVFVVNEMGLVDDIQEETSTHSEFAQYASDALAHWRFPVLTKDGKPVKVRFRLKFPFVIGSDIQQTNPGNTEPPPQP